MNLSLKEFLQRLMIWRNWLNKQATELPNVWKNLSTNIRLKPLLQGGIAIKKPSGEEVNVIEAFDAWRKMKGLEKIPK